MAGTLKIDGKTTFVGNGIRRRYIFTCSATAGQGYPGDPGETIDFTAATNPKKNARPIPPGPPAAPLLVTSQILMQRVPAGYTAEIKPAAASPTLKNFKLTIFASSATQISTADYPAGLAGKEIVFEVLSPQRYG